MTEKTEKNKSGAGKFFLGAALGAAAGAIASKFFSLDTSEEESDKCCDECPCSGKVKEDASEATHTESKPSHKTHESHRAKTPKRAPQKKSHSKDK